MNQTELQNRKVALKGSISECRFNCQGSTSSADFRKSLSRVRNYPEYSRYKESISIPQDWIFLCMGDIALLCDPAGRADYVLQHPLLSLRPAGMGFAGRLSTKAGSARHAEQEPRHLIHPRDQAVFRTTGCLRTENRKRRSGSTPIEHAPRQHECLPAAPNSNANPQYSTNCRQKRRSRRLS